MCTTAASVAALTAHVCFTVVMDAAQDAAFAALDQTVEHLDEVGLIAAWRSLVQDVYASNLDRHEPDELGDTAMTLGTQCSENVKTRAIRRASHDELELVEDHWTIPNLTVTNPRNSLTFCLDGVRVVVMKAPYAAGRAPQWDQLADWEHDSDVRQAVAASNMRTLQYRTHPAPDDPLFEHLGRPGVVDNYMLVWAGDSNAPLTAGWLTIPTLGESPFIAVKRIWWDKVPDERLTATRTPSSGPRFDERSVVAPQVTIKPRPTGEAQA